MNGLVLGGAAALVGCAQAVVLAWLDIAFLRSLRARRRVQTVAAAAPAIRSVLVDFLAGSDKQEILRQYLKDDAEALAETMFSFRGAVAGGARERLCELALELGLVRDWCAEVHAPSVVRRREVFARLAFVCAYEPCRRIAGDLLIAALEDADDQVRISAARGLIQTGEAETLEAVFEFTLASNQLTRAILAEDLRRYAAELSGRAIPKALGAMSDQTVLACLEVLAAWQRAVIVPDLPRLLEHHSPAVRMQALRLAPLVPITDEARAALLRALTAPDPEIATMAAISAGRLRIEESVPYLSAVLQGAGVEMARGAAGALAQMPPAGWKALEQVGAGASMVTAEIARAALSRVRGEARA